jgi:hypothetical protein
MKNLVRLAKIFDRFIELDSSFVLVEDIKAIRKEGSSIMVVTPYGEFGDSTDFDSFKTRITDTMEAMRDREPVAEERPLKSRIVPLPAPIFDSFKTKITDKVEASHSTPWMRRTLVEGFGKSGANGQLFGEEDLKVVNREQLEILGPDGAVLAKGTAGGTIIGNTVSGIIYESGKYTLADKGCGGRVEVVYQVQRR